MRDYPRTPMMVGSMNNPDWTRWLLDLKMQVDEIRTGPYVVHTVDAVFTQFDFGKNHMFTIGASNVEVQLPSVDETDIFSWLKVVRIGSGRLRINTSDSDRIENTSGPGSIWCDESNRGAANLHLQLVEEDLWAILGGTGIWKTI